MILQRAMFHPVHLVLVGRASPLRTEPTIDEVRTTETFPTLLPNPGDPPAVHGDLSVTPDARHAVARSPARRRTGVGLALLPLVAICLLSLWFPWDADEVLFAQGADRLRAGAVLYRDFWDIKQPGIYWFYQLGDLLGLGWLGVRLLEIALVVLAGAILFRVLAGWSLHPLARLAAPTLVLGSYVLLSHRSGVGQIEGLADILMVLVVAAAWPAHPGRRPGPSSGPDAGARPWWRWLLAGVVAGVVAVFKLLYLPLPVLLIAGAVLDTRVGAGRRIRFALAAAAGVALPIAATVLYLAVNGALPLAWTTSVRIPLEAVVRPELSEGRWRHLELLIGLSGLVLPLAVVALAGARRRGTALRDGTFALVAVVAAILALPQYPTPYRMLVLVAPLGLLAVQGASTVLVTVERWIERRVSQRDGARARRRHRLRLRLAVAAVIGVLALPMARGPERLLAQAGEIRSWSLSADDRLARDLVLTSLPLDRDAAPVRSMVRPGQAIYVLGDPRIYDLLGAHEAIEITGWAGGLMPPRVWTERDRELVRSRPEFVFVEAGALDDLVKLSPGFAVVVRDRYREVARTPGGTWYRTDAPGPPATIPGDNRLAG